MEENKRETEVADLKYAFEPLITGGADVNIFYKKILESGIEALTTNPETTSKQIQQIALDNSLADALDEIKKLVIKPARGTKEWQEDVDRKLKESSKAFAEKIERAQKLARKLKRIKLAIVSFILACICMTAGVS